MNLKTYVYLSSEYWDTKTHKNDPASCLYKIHRSVQSVRGT